MDAMAGMVTVTLPVLNLCSGRDVETHSVGRATGYPVDIPESMRTWSGYG